MDINKYLSMDINIKSKEIQLILYTELNIIYAVSIQYDVYSNLYIIKIAAEDKNDYNILYKKIWDYEKNETIMKVFPGYLKKSVNVTFDDVTCSLGFCTSNIFIEFTLDKSKDYQMLRSPDYYCQNIILQNKQYETSELGGMTDDQIMASPFVYISHKTQYDSLEKIFDHGSLDHRLSVSKRGIKVAKGGAGAMYYPEIPTIEKNAYTQAQYPGIYCDLITQRNLVKQNLYDDIYDIKEEGYSRWYQFVISLSVLKQRNYHINITDSYGAITNLTFSPNNIAKYLYMSDILYGNIYKSELMPSELVVHDKIPLELVSGILVVNDLDKEKCEKLLVEYGLNIPVYVKTRSYNLQLSQIQVMDNIIDRQYLNYNDPNYCYTGQADDGIYRFDTYNPYTNTRMKLTNDQIKKEEEYMWNMQLQNCGINEKYTHDNEDKLIKMIEDKMQDIYFNDGDSPNVLHYPPFKYTPEYYESLPKTLNY